MGRIAVTSDIRVIKNDLRKKYRLIRSELSKEQKSVYDDLIFTRIINSEFYKNAKTILCFVSTDIEVDTKRLIETALKDGKRVAVPKCLDKNGRMDFFVIPSLSLLRPSFFGLLEPDEKTAPRLRSYENSLCILPGFAFDRDGYRIGFGKGYYDRFLQKYIGIKAGICYNGCIADSLPHGHYDVAADYVVTQKYTITVNKKAETKKTAECGDKRIRKQRKN